MNVGFLFSKKVWCVMAFGFSLSVQGMGSKLVVKHLANEQNIVVLGSAKKFLLLPVQDDAPEGKVNIVINNKGQFAQSMNVRLARERIDSYVPLDLSAYVNQNVSIDIAGMPSSSLCWKELKMSDSFDMTNKEKFRPVYHHTPAYGWMNDPNGMFYKDGVYHCISSGTLMVRCGLICIGGILPVPI